MEGCKKARTGWKDVKKNLKNLKLCISHAKEGKVYEREDDHNNNVG